MDHAKAVSGSYNDLVEEYEEETGNLMELKAELKAADSKKWAAIKKAKVAEDKAAKYATRAERKEKEAAEARELADKYVADAKKMGSEAQAARGAAGAASKHVEVPKKK